MTKKTYYITHIQKTYAMIDAESEAEVRGWIESASPDDYEKNKWRPAEGDEYIESEGEPEKHYRELTKD